MCKRTRNNLKICFTEILTCTGLDFDVIIGKNNVKIKLGSNENKSFLPRSVANDTDVLLTQNSSFSLNK